MKRIIIILSILLGSIILNARSDVYSLTIPKCADISVNSIYLMDAESSQAVLGKNIRLIERENNFPIVPYYNKKKTQLLTLIFHPGSVKDSFSEFKVKRTTTNNNETIYTLKNIDSFVTGKQIQIGITKKQLIDILGDKFESEVKDGILAIKYKINNFEKSEFLQKYNMPSYYGEYRFINDNLIEYSFGFEYP